MAKIRDRHGKFSDLRPRKPVQISSHVIQWLRETYVEMPGSQIGGLCERLRPSLPWKIGYEIIAGIERPWLKDLVRDRIRKAALIELKTGISVHPEYDAPIRYERLAKAEDESFYRRIAFKPNRKKKPVRVPYVSLIGASRREAAKRAWAHRKALTKS